MKPYIVKDNTVLFRQSFARPVLAALFMTLWELGIEIQDSGSRLYPHRVVISESEFLSVIEMTKGA